MSHTENRLQLFPDTTTIENDALKIGGQEIGSLADRYGTPVYVYDRLTMDAAVERYRNALKAHYPEPASITYAAKAFWCKAIAQWADQRKLWADCSSEADIRVAVAAGLQRVNIILHGANKSELDLRAGIQQAGTLVVDNLGELRRFAELLRRSATGVRELRTSPSIWLRLQPGVSVETHHVHTRTGESDSKFGMTADEAREAARFARESSLAIDGLHFHLGSNFRDTAPLVEAIGVALDAAKELGLKDTWHFCPGGGWGVAYHEDELPHPDIDAYVEAIAHEVVKKCRLLGLTPPVLHLEPGRSLVARAGVAVYRVGSVKRRKHRTWLLVDGGMADNPRYALYGSKYSCLPAKGLRRAVAEMVSIGGPYCESGDMILEDLPMPRIEEGELLAIPVSGAYQLSMSSNYNGARRPAVIWLEKGRARLIVRRETLDELSHRDLAIS